ncbi:MAG TPA: radical SAM protein [Sulfurimonas sp.]|nr:radical SAM protein [Sulfurimonas sp.]
MNNGSKFKVLFIIQPDTRRIWAAVAEKLDAGREFRATLGLLCVAAMLKDFEDVECQLIDCSARNFGYPELHESIKSCNPDLVCMSALTFSLLDVRKSAHVAKEACPNTKICLGGVHVNLFPAETLNLKEVDYIVHGEGEKPFREMVRALKDGNIEAIKSVEGVGCKVGSETILNGPGEIIRDMDSFPIPAYDLLDLTKYSHVLSEGKRSMSIQTSRGCPYACTFCDIRKTAFRFKSPEKVVEEIMYLMKTGNTDFFIVDDTISVHKNRLNDICELIIKKGIKITFKISARVDNLDEESLNLLKRAGCNRINFGVESGSQRLLDYLEKDVTLQQIKETFRMTREAGIQTFAYLIIGIPTETTSEMEKSVEFVSEIRADYFNISICTPYPKTALTDRMIADNLIPSDYWQKFAEDPKEDFRVQFWNNAFKDDELRGLQQNLMKKFYRRPAYLLRELSKIRSGSEFLRKAKVGLRILR